MRLTHPTGDQLGILGAEVNNKNWTVCADSHVIFTGPSIRRDDGSSLVGCGHPQHIAIRWHC
jgi:hypothetical protein